MKGVLNFYFSKPSVGITFTFTLRKMTIFSARTYTVYHFTILWMKPSTVSINQKGVNRSKLTDITFVCSLLSLSDIANDSWCQKLKPLQSARGLFQSSDNEFETFLHQTRACLMNRFDSVPRDIEYKRIGYNCNTQQTCPQIPRVKTETFVHFVIWHYTGELKVRSTSIYFNVSAFVV